MALVSPHAALTRIYTLLTGAGLTVYQHGEKLPEPLPDNFVVLQPLNSVTFQEYAVRKTTNVRIRIVACSRQPGVQRAALQTINDALPPDEFHWEGTGWENRSETHYETPVTVQVTQ